MKAFLFVQLLLLTLSATFCDATLNLQEVSAILETQNVLSRFMFLLDEITNADGHDTQVVRAMRNLMQPDVVMVVEGTTTLQGKDQIINFIVNFNELGTSDGVRITSVPEVLSVDVVGHTHRVTMRARIDLHHTVTATNTRVHQIKSLNLILKKGRGEDNFTFERVELDTALAGLTY